jgi:hypothetical protein
MQETLTKGEIALFAIRKSGIASDATNTDIEPNHLDNAVNDLEDMMYEWLIVPRDIGYIFSGEATPKDGDDSGLPRKYKHAVGYQLLLRIISDFGLEPTPRQLANANRAYEALLIDTLHVPSIQRRGDFPQGQGNKGRLFYPSSSAVNGDKLKG